MPMPNAVVATITSSFAGHEFFLHSAPPLRVKPRMVTGDAKFTRPVSATTFQPVCVSACR